MADEKVVGGAVERLNANERDRLTQLEVVVERGIKTFIEVGLALTEIRDSRLYRETHSSFEEYVKARWDMSRGHAYRLIDATAVMECLQSGDSGVLPRNEAQVRPLLRIYRNAEEDDPGSGAQAVREKWDEIVAEHGRSITAAKVRAACPRPASTPSWFDQLRLVEDTVEELAGLELEAAWATVLAYGQGEFAVKMPARNRALLVHGIRRAAEKLLAYAAVLDVEPAEQPREAEAA